MRHGFVGVMPWRAEGRRPTRAELLSIMPAWKVDGRIPTVAEMAAYRLEVIELGQANEAHVRTFELGERCVFCGARFENANGYLAACDACWRAHPGERDGIQPSVERIDQSAIDWMRKTPGRGDARPGAQAGATSRAAGTR